MNLRLKMSSGVLTVVALATSLTPAAESARPRDESIRRYLQAERPARITRVAVNSEAVTIASQVPAGRTTEWKLVEFPPNRSSIDADPAIEVVKIETSGAFRHSIERYAEDRDRSLSRWAILAVMDGETSLASHACYADDPPALPRVEVTSKKRHGRCSCRRQLA